MATDWESDGTLSANDFQIAARDLIERWKQIDPAQPPWSWNSSQIGVYLSLENIYCSGENGPTSSYHQNKDEGVTYHHSSEEINFGEDEDYDYDDDTKDIAALVLDGNKDYHHSSEEINFGEDEDYDDDTKDIAALVLDGNKDMHAYDFHIIYSYSYKVPVLYFRGCKHDGQPLDSRTVEKDLPLYSSTIMKESKWTYITQEEHPFLHRPWYMLHPCGTSEWMKLLLLVGRKESEISEIERYLPSWLSVVGQAVGLKIPLKSRKNQIPISASVRLAAAAVAPA